MTKPLAGKIAPAIRRTHRFPSEVISRLALAASALCVALASWNARAADDTQVRPKALSAEQAISFRSISELRPSPDRSRVAITVAEPPDGAKRLRHIWVYSVALGQLKQLTSSSGSETQPRWSPDGRELAFLSDRDATQAIYTLPMNGGEAQRLTRDKQSIKAFEWSPDGRNIGYLAPDLPEPSHEEKVKSGDDARSVDRDDPRVHVWIYDVRSRTTRQLMGAPWEAKEIKWFPQADRLLIVATDQPESHFAKQRILQLTIDSGKVRELVAPTGPFGNVRLSPDGRLMSYIGSRIDGPRAFDLYVQPVDGSAKNLTAAAIDQAVLAYEWNDNQELAAWVSDGFRSKLYSVNVAGTSKLVTTMDISVNAFTGIGPSRRTLFAADSLTHPAELWEWRAGAKPTQHSQLNSTWEQVALVEPRFLEYKSFDGRRIEAALLAPQNKAGAAPTVVLVHGGPAGQWENSFDALGQMLATAGFAVLYPNIRGSTGYGFEFLALNRGDWGGGDFKDVMAGVDHLISQGIADPDRLAIAGRSYGGYMAAWAVTQTQRFKGAVSVAGMSDLATEFGTEEDPAYDEWYFGLPYDAPEKFRNSSPITFVRSARTPILLIHGENDVIDPLSQSEMFYRALKRYSVETELVVYPREGHALREQRHLIDALNRAVDWLTRHVAK